MSPARAWYTGTGPCQGRRARRRINRRHSATSSDDPTRPEAVAARAAARGVTRAFLVADMPFMTYATPEQGLACAARLMQEGGAMMVKLEGGSQQAEVVEFMTGRGIPVCAHIGLQPQMVHKLGGYKVQGKGDAAAQRMREDAVALERAGADLILLECVPNRLAAEIAASVRVPVIGIGAGPGVGVAPEHVKGRRAQQFETLGARQARLARRDGAEKAGVERREMVERRGRAVCGHGRNRGLGWAGKGR